MKIVILDGYAVNPGDISWEEIAAQGELTLYDRTSHTDAREIRERIGDAEIVFTNKVPLTEEILGACPALRYIGVLATGYNVVDVSCAGRHGVVVTNIPAYGTEAVAQYAIALLLEICSRVGHHDATVHAGRWEKSVDFCYWDMPLIELAGKTMGIIGFGRIGRATGRIAKALGMRVLAAGSRPCAEGEALAEYVPLDALLARSDVIALHCPLRAETEGLIHRETIGKMKDGVILINNSRGGLIVEEDLAAALQSGKVAAAGLDVASTEPIRSDNPLLHAPNCFITPHISWAPTECRERIVACAAENLRAFLRGEPVNVVNG